MGFPRLPRSWLKRRDVDQPRGPAEGPAAAGGWWLVAGGFSGKMMAISFKNMAHGEWQMIE